MRGPSDDGRDRGASDTGTTAWPPWSCDRSDSGATAQASPSEISCSSCVWSRTNGKAERFNRTMKEEWLYVRSYPSDEERTTALAGFLNSYNHERPHSSLGNKPPASRVPVTTYRVQPQSKDLDMPRIEVLGHEPTLFDLPETTS
jgi:hypothetical protein